MISNKMIQNVNTDVFLQTSTNHHSYGVTLASAKIVKHEKKKLLNIVL
jgi:hypothetical protein